jgi:hypothetical protein
VLNAAEYVDSNIYLQGVVAGRIVDVFPLQPGIAIIIGDSVFQFVGQYVVIVPQLLGQFTVLS